MDRTSRNRCAPDRYFDWDFVCRSNWDSFTAWARSEGVAITGASGDAIQSYRGANYSSISVLLMGSERKGLSQEQREACTNLVSIPMLGKYEVNLPNAPR